MNDYFDRAAKYFQGLAHHESSWERAGWSSSASQERRFDAILRASDLDGHSVIDVGGGDGSLALAARRAGVQLASYLSLDLVPANCQKARDNGLRAYIGDHRILAANCADTVVASGILNFPSSDWLDVLADVCTLITRASRYAAVLTVRPPERIGIRQAQEVISSGRVLFRSDSDYRDGEALWVVAEG